MSKDLMIKWIWVLKINIWNLWLQRKAAHAQKKAKRWKRIKAEGNKGKLIFTKEYRYEAEEIKYNDSDQEKNKELFNFLKYNEEEETRHS